MVAHLRCNLHTRHALHDELGSYSGLGLSNILWPAIQSMTYPKAALSGCIPEQELSVQVTNVDRVHVDDMDILKP